MGLAEQELDILEEISQILGDALELRQVFQRAMALLSERLNIQRAALLLWDEATDQVRIVAAIGLSSEEMQRGRDYEAYRNWIDAPTRRLNVAEDGFGANVGQRSRSGNPG